MTMREKKMLRAERRLLNKELVKSSLTFFAVMFAVLSILGFFIYYQVSSSLFSSVDKRLYSVRDSISEPGDLGFFASSIGGQDAFEFSPPIDEDSELDGKLSKVLLEAADNSIGENPLFIFTIRDVDGRLVNAVSMYSSYPRFLDQTSFNTASLEVPEVRFYDGVSLRVLSFKLESGSDLVGYAEVMAGVDSEVSILHIFTKTMIIGFTVALVLAACLSFFLSKRAVRPLTHAWRKQADFVQNASHELKTPLAVIKASQELLLEKPNDRIIDHFENIVATVEESDRLARLAEDLLSLTALDSDEPQLDRSSFDLVEVLGSMTTAYSEYASLQGKQIAFSGPDSIVLCADLDKIRQLAAIVLDNAVKYTEPGDRIEVSTYSGGRNVYIEVRDTGIGISAEDAHNAFDRFYRADKARASQGGRGLGLAMAKAIVQAHDGCIEIGGNLVGRGTRVLITLPHRVG